MYGASCVVVSAGLASKVGCIRTAQSLEFRWSLALLRSIWYFMSFLSMDLVVKLVREKLSTYVVPYIRSLDEWPMLAGCAMMQLAESLPWHVIAKHSRSTMSDLIAATHAVQ